MGNCGSGKGGGRKGGAGGSASAGVVVKGANEPPAGDAEQE